MTPDEIKETVTMWEVLEALDIPHAPSTTGTKIPAITRDERTPSLHVYPDHWFDYGDGTGGSVIDFVMAYYGCSFRRAMQWLESLVDYQASDVDKPSKHHTSFALLRKEPNPAVGEYFRHHSVSFDDLAPAVQPYVREKLDERWPWLNPDHFRIRFTFEGSGMWIPHYDTSDPRGERIAGVKVRVLTNGAKKSMKGSCFTKNLYRPSAVPMHKHSNFLIILEGESDAWLWSTIARHKGAVIASLPAGVNSARRKWDLGSQVKYVTLAFDADDSGREAVKIWKEQNLATGVLVPPSPHKDWCDWYRANPRACTVFIRNEAGV